MLPTTVSAAPTVVAYDDGTIYVGGIYDMWAQISPGADRATYQWQMSIGGDDYYGSGAWYDINDLTGDYGYKGTKTSHLQIVGKPNDDSVAIGGGWENMKFRCKITLDGKEYFTNSLSELRHNTAMLNAVIKAGKYKLYEPKVAGVDKLSGSGSSYTAKAEAGRELTFNLSCTDVSDTRLVASEFQCIPEIWITDSNTTVHAAKELKYAPTKADSQLTVEFKLRMKIGVNDLGYTETKTLQLSTYLPDHIGSGTAKNRTLIYTTASTSSKRLATVATGGTVAIIEKVNENWYKVAYNNHVGYAQAADLTAVVTQTVNEVKAYLPVPAVGKNPRFDATYATAGVQLYKTDPVSWYDETAKKFLTATDTFQAGHSYTLSIWFAAAEGYRFRTNGSDPQVTGYINDSVISVYKAYGEQSEKVIELQWTYVPLEAAHTCSLTPVKQKDPDCTNPGKKAYYQCSGCGECYADAQGKNKISLTAWGNLPATGHTLSAWKATGVYHYKACTVCGDISEQADHSPGSAATETTPQTCTVCSYVITPAKNHIHSLKEVAANAPTCTKTGRIAHYMCADCGQLFADQTGNTPLTDSILLPATGHTAANGFGYDAQFHWQGCMICGEHLPETKAPHEITQGKCDLCDYIPGTEITPPETTTPEETSPALPEKTPSSGNSWIGILLLGLVCFTGAIVITVIILKKR